MTLEQIKQKSLSQREFDRLNRMFVELAVRSPSALKDVEVGVTVKQWSEGITQQLLQWWYEEHDNMEYPTGTRISAECFGPKARHGKKGGVVKYGLVIVNDFVFRT